MLLADKNNFFLKQIIETVATVADADGTVQAPKPESKTDRLRAVLSFICRNNDNKCHRIIFGSEYFFMCIFHIYINKQRRNHNGKYIFKR